jgi:hypothetical protein
LTLCAFSFFEEGVDVKKNSDTHHTTDETPPKTPNTEFDWWKMGRALERAVNCCELTTEPTKTIAYFVDIDRIR